MRPRPLLGCMLEGEVKDDIPILTHVPLSRQQQPDNINGSQVVLPKQAGTLAASRVLQTLACAGMLGVSPDRITIRTLTAQGGNSDCRVAGDYRDYPKTPWQA